MNVISDVSLTFQQPFSRSLTIPEEHSLVRQTMHLFVTVSVLSSKMVIEKSTKCNKLNLFFTYNSGFDPKTQEATFLLFK